MRFRYTKKQLAELDDLEFLAMICQERQSDCTNINSPLFARLAETKARLNIQMEEIREKDKEDDNKHVQILHHDISYYFDDNSEIELGDSESEHIEYMIGQGYREGDLSKESDNSEHTLSLIEKEEDTVSGYWRISK